MSEFGNIAPEVSGWLGSGEAPSAHFAAAGPTQSKRRKTAMRPKIYPELVFCLLFGAAALFAGKVSAADYANPELLTSVETLAARSDMAPGETHVLYGENTVVVDVRPIAGYLKGRIPSARHLDPDAFSEPDSPVTGALRSQAALAEIIGNLGITAKTKVVLYDDKGGFHAARVFWVLEYLGHRHVSILDGGIQRWIAKGLTIDIGRPATAMLYEKAGRYAATRTPRRYASADWILAHRDDPNTVVIDVRGPNAFAKGHIPWARNIPWSDNLAADKRLKSADALRAHFEAHGVTPTHNIVVHCEAGKASSHTYFALRLLGYPRVRTYHRSWSEWGAAEDLPKSTSTEG